MDQQKIVSLICSIPESETGGDNALDGFEFQVSSAIYLIFEFLNKKQDFSLIYEKLEDFIIVTNSINLYQAKSINTRLTPLVLYKSQKTSTSKGDSSIFFKMYRNYLDVKNVMKDQTVTNTLIICKNLEFSRKLVDDSTLCNSLELCFSNISQKAKKVIEANVSHTDIKWDVINARRLIPKDSHEEMTRIFIEDVVSSLFGENKISSSSLYNSLCMEIRKIRKSKTSLNNQFLVKEITKYVSLDYDIDFSDYVYLLNSDDSKNIQLITTFNTLKTIVTIHNSPEYSLYDKVKFYFKGHLFANFYDYYNYLFEILKKNEPNIVIDEYIVKALVLIYFAKEVL